MKNLFCIVYLLLIVSISSAQNINVPAWVVNNDTIEKSEVKSQDYEYLKNWITKNALPVNEYFYNFFSDHQLVILGEQHNIKEHKSFIIQSIDSLYFKCGVRAIAWEFSSYADNKCLDSLINMPIYDSLEVLNFARAQAGHSWNSKDHWDIIKAVWQLNHKLPDNCKKMKLIGIDINEDISDLIISLHTKPDTSLSYQKALQTVSNRDRIMARHVDEEIMKKGITGLVFVGRCHDYTRHTLTGENPMSKYIMGNELYKIHGDKIFQVWLYSGWFDIMESLLADEPITMIGFNVLNSPFSNILKHTGWQNDKPAPFSEIAEGFIYIKPKDNLHENTTIEGFVNTDMFNKYQNYYHLSYSDSIKNASELDRYLQENRWKWKVK